MTTPNPPKLNTPVMHKTPQGAETLRLIVRDDVAGAANVIANALWNGLQ